MPSRTAIAIASALVAFLVGVEEAAAGPPERFQVRTVVSGLDQPTSFAIAPDGAIYIAEKAGLVKVFREGSTAVFLDLREQVNSASERGLLGLRLDPDFASNRRLYLLFTRELEPRKPDEDTPAGGVLLRLQASRDDGSRPQPRSERVLLSGFVSHGPWHSVAGLEFDAQGRLLVGFGDGTLYHPDIFGVESLIALDLDSLNGKVVRIAPDTGHGVRENPYFDRRRPDAVRSKVLARGLRNPFRLSVDPAAGRVYVGDVGTNHWEEIDVIDSRASRSRAPNFGWPCYEGGHRTLRRFGSMLENPRCLALFRSEGRAAAALPADYAYVSTQAAVVVGPVYPGGPYPDRYDGRLFFADFVRDMVWTYDGSSATGFGTAGGWGNPVDVRMTDAGTLVYAGFTAGELRELTYEPRSRGTSVAAVALWAAGLLAVALAASVWRRRRARA